jgi:hypothetical protein
LAAGLVALVGGLLVNGCQISKLLSSPSQPGGSGGGLIVVVPSEVRDSAVAGTSAMHMATLAVSNGGSWSATTTDDWIHLNPSSGGPHGTLRLSLDPKSLTPGWHSGVVTLQEQQRDVSTTVSVDFKIQQPVLKVDPANLSYEARDDHSVFYDTLRVTNEGDGPLVWTATIARGSAWIVLADTGGSGPGPLPVRTSNVGLSFFGTYRDTIVVTSPGAKNSPKRIPVSLRRKRHG